MTGKLRDALPDHQVSRRVARGSRSGEIRLTFVLNKAESARWLHFEPLKSNLVFHSDQGWGAFLDFPISGRDFRVAPIIAIDNGDDLIEEYSGFGLRFESRKLGTERLGASFEWSTFDQTWRSATLDALALNPRIPGAYDDRSTVTPLVRFAVTQQLRVGGGVSITELEPLSGVPDSQMANAAIASIGYDDQWEQGDASHDVGAEFIVRAASETLESDFDYTRYFGQAAYRYRRAKHTVLVSGMAGGISGDAPLFERFSLGDSRTLRGWDKYRHRAGWRRSHVPHVTGISISRSGALSRLRIGVGRRHRRARAHRGRNRPPSGAVLHDPRFSAQYRRGQGGVHDGRPLRRHRIPEGLASGLGRHQRAAIIDTVSTRRSPAARTRRAGDRGGARVARGALSRRSRYRSPPRAGSCTSGRRAFASSKASRSRA